MDPCDAYRLSSEDQGIVDVLEQEASSWRSKLDAVVAGVKLVLDLCRHGGGTSARWQATAPGHHHRQVQGSVGELQKLQPRRHYLHRDPCPGGNLVSLPYHRSASDRGQIRQRDWCDEAAGARR